MGLYHVSTGIGSGLIYDHHIMRGHTGTAGEVGHVSIDANGIPYVVIEDVWKNTLLHLY